MIRVVLGGEPGKHSVCGRVASSGGVYVLGSSLHVRAGKHSRVDVNMKALSFLPTSAVL